MKTNYPKLAHGSSKIRLDNVILAVLRYVVLTALGTWLAGTAARDWLEAGGVQWADAWAIVTGATMAVVGVWWGLNDGNKRAHPYSTRKLQTASAIRKTIAILASLLVSLNLFPEHDVTQWSAALVALLGAMGWSVGAPEKIYKARVLGQEMPEDLKELAAAVGASKS